MRVLEMSFQKISMSRKNVLFHSAISKVSRTLHDSVQSLLFQSFQFVFQFVGRNSKMAAAANNIQKIAMAAVGAGGIALGTQKISTTHITNT